MAGRLKPSPLGTRIAPPVPLRNGLWRSARRYDGVLIASSSTGIDQFVAWLACPGQLRQVGDFYCLIFDHAQTLDPADLGAVLPLRFVGPGMLSSCDLDPLSQGPGGANQLHVRHHGQSLWFDLDSATPVEALDFWDLSRLDVMRARALPGPAKAQTPHIPRQSAPLESVAKTAPIYADIRSSVQSAQSHSAMDWLRSGVRGVRRILSVVFWIGVALFVLAIFAGAIVAQSLAMAWAGVWVVIAAVWALAHLRSRSPARVGSKAGVSRRSAPSEPGLLAQMKSWVLWNTRWGDRLRADLARHIKDVDRMIERGEIDRALKRALALGAKKDAQSKRSAMGPTGLPQKRASLDMDLSGIEPRAASILDDGSFAQMARRYRQLAQDLAAKGDHQRAAFVFSELLGDVPLALLELEKLGAYEDAAKLATARKSPANVTVRLWFLAGKKDIAIALAKRFGALEFIANAAETKDPGFAAFVRGHWIRDLIAAGDLAGAVTHSAGRPALEKLHVAVTQQAVLAGLLDQPAVLGAAVMALDWTPGALDDDRPTSGNSAVNQLERRLHRLVYDAAPADAPARHGLIATLSTQRPRTRATPDAFWADRAPRLGDALIRASLAYDIDHPARPTLADLHQLAKALHLSVLAEDLRHVVRSNPAPAPKPRKIELPAAPPCDDPNWIQIAAVDNGQTLLAAQDGELTLLDENGKRRWTDHVTALVGLVPIGPGRLVILVQQSGADKQLTLLDTALQSYRALGHVALLDWDQTATAAMWLVRTPNAIGALDVAAMIDEVARFDMLWSITQTVPVVVLGFNLLTDRARWVTQRDTHGRPGLIETWELPFAKQDLDVRMLDPSDLDNGGVYLAAHVCTAKNKILQASQTLSAHSMPQRIDTRLIWYSYDTEQQILAANAPFFADLTRFANLTLLGDCETCVITNQTCAEPSAQIMMTKKQHFLVLGGCRAIVQHAHLSGRRIAAIDDHQRIIIVDFDKTTVVIAQL
ncbi:MAG: hypothetical protein AB8B51_12195 [Sedimentitalea sp.]